MVNRFEKNADCRKPTASVLMLSYNHASYIRQAIDSVLRQKTDFLFEILVGDDASSDGTADIVRDYAIRYPGIIVPFIREKNMGATKNLYDLMECARGEYLAYLECDDYWSDETKLQQQIHFLQTNGEYIGCTHKIATVDCDGNEYQQKFAWISDCEHYTLQDFCGIILPGHISSLVHRNIFSAANGKYQKLITQHPMIADRMLCVILASKGDLYQLPQKMSCYRSPDSNRDGATAKLYLDNPRELLDEYLYTVNLRNCVKKELQIAVDFSYHIKELLSVSITRFRDKPSLLGFYTVLRIFGGECNLSLLMHLIRKLIRKIDKVAS